MYLEIKQLENIIGRIIIETFIQFIIFIYKFFIFNYKLLKVLCMYTIKSNNEGMLNIIDKYKIEEYRQCKGK
jgi:hypothetical protein